jgi:hypothetical protein
MRIHRHAPLAALIGLIGISALLAAGVGEARAPGPHHCAAIDAKDGRRVSKIEAAKPTPCSESRLVIRRWFSSGNRRGHIAAYGHDWRCHYLGDAHDAGECLRRFLRGFMSFEISVAAPGRSGPQLR